MYGYGEQARGLGEGLSGEIRRSGAGFKAILPSKSEGNTRADSPGEDLNLNLQWNGAPDRI